MPTIQLPLAADNIGNPIWVAADTDADTDPLTIETTGGDLIVGWFGSYPIHGGLTRAGVSSVTISFPFATCQLIALGAGFWYITHSTFPGLLAKAIWQPTGANGAQTLDEGSFNVASVIATDSGTKIEVTLETLSLGDFDIVTEGVAQLTAKVVTGTDTTADYILEAISQLAPHFIFELGERNKNGQFSSDTWAGTDHVVLFEVK